MKFFRLSEFLSPQNKIPAILLLILSYSFVSGQKIRFRSNILKTNTTQSYILLNADKSSKTDIIGIIKDYYSSKGKRPLFILPYAAWNNYDKLYAGAGIFTNPVRKTKLRLRFFPAWSFGADKFVYAGNFSWHHEFSDEISFIEPFFTAHSYSYDKKDNLVPGFTNFNAGLNLQLGQENAHNPFTSMMMTWHYIKRDLLLWNNLENSYELTNRTNSILAVKVSSNIIHISKENKQQLEAEFSKDAGKISFSTLHRFQNEEKKTLFEFRIFAGTFLYSEPSLTEDYRFRLSGISGKNDYLYSNPFLSRSESTGNFLTNQVYPGDGFFKTLVPLGQTWDWMTTLNLRGSFPGKIPLQFYVDIGTYKNAGTLFPGNKTLPWNGGMIVQIWKDYIEVFVPLLMSDDIKSIYQLNNIDFFSRISWMIRFDEINPFKLLQKNNK
jgi:hypothetical protein